jgi:hypothetical protein
MRYDDSIKYSNFAMTCGHLNAIILEEEITKYRNGICPAHRDSEARLPPVWATYGSWASGSGTRLMALNSHRERVRGFGRLILRMKTETNTAFLDTMKTGRKMLSGAFIF